MCLAIDSVPQGDGLMQDIRFLREQAAACLSAALEARSPQDANAFAELATRYENEARFVERQQRSARPLNIAYPLL